jgi:hypothetical protein
VTVHVRWIWILLLIVSRALAQDQGEGMDNIGRTEEDDQTEEVEDSRQLGKMGAAKIAVNIEQDCQATLALYTPKGQLVRILAQVVNLKKGQYTLRWDGMDLFGNMVPVGQELVLKLITNQPLKAYYEFSVLAPKVQPWTYREGEGPSQRSGGWMGDHSPPSSAVAIGQNVYLGCTLAEYGDNLIAVNLQGQKLWGGKLAGWTGPRRLATDGHALYALHRAGTTIFRSLPEATTGQHRQVKLCELPRVATSIAVAGQKLYAIGPNDQRTADPFRVALGSDSIDYVRSQPQVLNVTAASEHHISPQRAFGNVFTTPGNPQNIAGMVRREGDAYLVLTFKAPVEVGSIVLGPVDGAQHVEFYALDEGLKYDEQQHSPLRKDELGLGADVGGNWVSFGQADATAPLSLLSAPKKPLKTSAVYIKALTDGKTPANWRPKLQMARLLRQRVQRLDKAANMHVLGDGEAAAPQKVTGVGWKVRTRFPVSDIYPQVMILELDGEQVMDGVALLNCVNPQVEIEALAAGTTGDVTKAPAEAWRAAGVYRGAFDKRVGSVSASRKSNERFVSFGHRLTTRALRFRVTGAHRSGKWGDGEEDPFRVQADDVAPVRLADFRAKPPSHSVVVVETTSGKIVHQDLSDAYALPVLAAAPDGRLYSVVNNRLCRVRFEESGEGKLHSEPLSEAVFKEPIAMAASADRIAVGDALRQAVVVFDHSGKQQFVIGDRGPRARGPWDVNRVERPQGVAIAADGSIWVCEDRYTPKRVARFAADGKFIEEFFGPPMYGGGGYLDPDLKHFHYQAAQYELDWAAGTSRLKSLNDRPFSQETPTQGESGFTYTSLGAPMYHKGRRYIVRGATICLLESDVWRACVVMGSAPNNAFLLGKDCWKQHWAKFDLRKKQFIWCDRNDDGQYQVDEVELFDNAQGPQFWSGVTVGPDFKLWGNHIILRPHDVTAAGTPLFRAADIQPFDYDQLAPHYSRNYTLGGPRSAKPNYFGFKRITEDGLLIQEGQPFIVNADGKSLLGGPTPAKPGDFMPPIDGVVPHTPFCFAGGAMTKSAIGEVAVMHSMNGYAFVWAAKYGVCVGRYFTGEKGGWGYFKGERGMDVTGRKHAWEAWHGDFIKGHDGKYYAQAGKGFHAIARIEGLDDYKISQQPVNVVDSELVHNQRLRAVLVARRAAASAAKASPRTITSRSLSRLKDFKLDGSINDWGNRLDMQSLGDAKKRLLFDAASDARGLYLAFYGENRLENTARQIKDVLQGGFCIDLQWRTPALKKGAAENDRRLVIAKLQGKWTGVFFDYTPAEPTPKQAVEYSSPLASEQVGSVRQLAADDWKFVINEDAGADAVDAVGDVRRLGVEPVMPGEEPKNAPPRPEGTSPWSAELFIPWSLLGTKPGGTLRFDAGMLLPNAKTQHPERQYWSNLATITIVDPALEALLNPAAWGTLTFAP